MKKLLSFLFCCFALSPFAQERCAVAKREEILSQNLDYVRQKSVFESQVRSFLEENGSSEARVAADELIRIPVVVHVIHNTASNAIGGTNNPNISVEQINSQIRVLNEDYRRKVGTNGYNTNPIGVDMNIEFYLANTDPNGNPSTGITRHYNAKTGWNFQIDQAAIAKVVTWDTDRYLNIYVAVSDGQYIGYSSLPYDSQVDGLKGNSADIALLKTFDGVLLDYKVFGTCCGTLSPLYALGRSVTHEIGHWLGLLHTNGDVTCGTDYCDDTPTIESLNLSSKNVCTALTSNCLGVSTKNQIENYMDYSPDKCMNLFTANQKARARAVLSLSAKRKALLSSLTKVEDTSNLVLSVLGNPIQNNTITLKASFTGTQDLEVTLYDMRGNKVYGQDYMNQSSGYITIVASTFQQDMYVVRVKTKNESQGARVAIVR
ncbi:MAG: M43 family zinc metalloprotease [Spirosomataceae bacterium]